MSSLQFNQESAVASIPMSQPEQLYNGQQAHPQINSGSGPSLPPSGHHLPNLSNIHQLDHVQYHHQNSQFVNQIPTDPFALAALENAMMYVPEISDVPRASSQMQESQGPTHVIQNVSSSVQPIQDGEVEMFEDIVANTNPYLAALPDANLYMTHNVNYFDSKRNLLRASNSHNDFYAFEKNIASEVGSQADQIVDFNDYELDLDDNYSDFSYSEADEEMLQLFNPDSAGWSNHYHQPVQGSRRRRQPKLNCTLRQFNDRAFEQEEPDKVSQAENQSVRNIQLHSLMNPAERSECCCADDDFKDNGLDSTMSISIYDQGGPTQRPSRRLVSEREGNEINSHRAEGQPHKDSHSKKRKEHRSLGRRYVSRNALSQMNYKDLEDEQDMRWEYGLEADEEDFEKMMMLQEDEESQFQQGVLQLNRHKSAVEKGRLADSVSYISKSNQKPDLRKKKSLAVNFREDLNVEACSAALKTPQQDSRQLMQDDEFLIPISQTPFEAGLSREQDKLETENVSKDTRPAKILGYYQFDILKNQKMDSQFGTFDKNLTKEPKRNYQNPRQLMNSNIQYQFLKYNGFKPMNVEQQCDEDKVEDYFRQPQQQAGLANYFGTPGTFDWGSQYNLPCDTWQLGLPRCDDVLAECHQHVKDIEYNQTNQQIQISDEKMDIYNSKPQKIAQKIKKLEQEQYQMDYDSNQIADKLKESILQSGIKNILKNGSKKITKESKIEEKEFKIKKKASVHFIKSKRVDQNKRVTTKQPFSEQSCFNSQKDHDFCEPQIDLKIIPEDQSQDSKVCRRFDDEGFDEEEDNQYQNKENEPVQDNNNENHEVKSEASDSNMGKNKEQVLILSDDNLKINIPFVKQAEIELIEGSEVEDNVQMQMKRKKCRAQKTKYYQNFDFFFKRSCFRTMTEFYKDKFNSFHKKRLSKMKLEQPVAWNKYMKNGGIKSLSKDQMYLIVQGFIDHIFGKDILTNNTCLDSKQKKLIILRVMMILFSHRHTKRDTFIEQAQQEALQSGSKQLSIDFSTIRDVMYKYSKKAEEKYFQCETESFMFAAFALSDEGVNFLKEKPDNCKDNEKLNRILRDLTALKDQALISLEMMSQGKVIKTSLEGSETQGAEQISDSKQCDEQQQALQPQCDLQVGAFLFSELKKMTKNMI